MDIVKARLRDESIDRATRHLKIPREEVAVLFDAAFFGEKARLIIEKRALAKKAPHLVWSNTRPTVE